MSAVDTRHVLHDLDLALAALIRPALADTVELRFDPPDPDWSERRDGRQILGLFLHTVEEDLGARAGEWSDLRDEEGRVVARLPPTRRYRFCYLAAPWCAEPDVEHTLLGGVLAALGEHQRLPDDQVPESLRGPGSPVLLDVANPGLPRAPLSLWHALDVRPRAALDVVLTAAMPRVPMTRLAAAPEEIGLGVGRGGTPAPARPSPTRPRRRVTEP